MLERKKKRQARRDLTGQVFGYWEVIDNLTDEEWNRGKGVIIKVKCKCQCGTIRNVSSQLLVSGGSKCCGCIKKIKPKKSIDRSHSRSIRRKSVVGEKFGSLTVVDDLFYEEWNSCDLEGGIKVQCKCDCGNVKNIALSSLRHGRTSSCGCLRYIRAKNPNALKNHKKYKTWMAIRERCFSTNHPNYKNYGARGITLEEPWLSDARSFLDWYDSNCGGNYKLQVDRIDTNGNYSPANCRLVTAKENNRNRRNNKVLTAFGVTATLPELHEQFSNGVVSYSSLQYRIKQGWDLERALTEPAGLSQTPAEDKPLRRTFHDILRKAISRCHNTSDKGYSSYGGKGISVCDEWQLKENGRFLGVDNFMAWSLANGWERGLQLDRIDSCGPYSPENCRWSSRGENQNNKLSNKIMTYKEDTDTVSNLVRKYSNICYSTVMKRLETGYTIEEAIDTSLQ